MENRTFYKLHIVLQMIEFLCSQGPSIHCFDSFDIGFTSFYMCFILIDITPFFLFDCILRFFLSPMITSFQEFYFIYILISLLFTNMCLYNYTCTVKHVLSDPCVICFPVLSDLDFHALLTIFYVFYTV